jgi:hypothetical protein
MQTIWLRSTRHHKMPTPSPLESETALTSIKYFLKHIVFSDQVKKRNEVLLCFSFWICLGGRFLCLEFSKVTNPLLGKIYDEYSFNVIPGMGQVFVPSFCYTADANGFFLGCCRRSWIISISCWKHQKVSAAGEVCGDDSHRRISVCLISESLAWNRSNPLWIQTKIRASILLIIKYVTFSSEFGKQPQEEKYTKHKNCYKNHMPTAGCISEDLQPFHWCS